MTTAPGPIGLELRQIVQERVGGFFRNTYAPGVAEVCAVCRGPATSDLCAVCKHHRSNFGNRLADKVVMFTYAQGNQPGVKHQSAHEMFAYKWSPPVAICRENLQLVVAAGTTLHDRCIANWVGAEVDSLTFVPSVKHPGPEHPVVQLAKAVYRAESTPVLSRPLLQRFRLDVGPGINSRRVVVEDKFVVPAEYRHAVFERNVLIVDDTWASGASIQSAAIAVNDAGARSVTALCVGRWLRWDWEDHAKLLASLTAPYDPLACPVQGVVCAASIGLG